jgi:ADP-ribose pyrophosphatase YjhB (NUDIX family)
VNEEHRPLTDYPRPSVAVDTAVLTVADSLHVLLVRAHDGLRLPGTFVHERETLADAVLRSLTVKAGITGLAPRQLHVFDDPDRDDRGWVLSVAHVDIVPRGRLELDDALAELVAVGELPALPYGHEQIVARAVRAVRSDYREQPDPAGLLDEPFTLRQLHTLHEQVAGEALPRDSFRRTFEPRLVPTGATTQGVVGKPARLFERQADAR